MKVYRTMPTKVIQIKIKKKKTHFLYEHANI